MRWQETDSNLPSPLLLLIARVSVDAVVAAVCARSGTLCCQITSINSSTGVVNGRVNATGQAFQFTVTMRASAGNSMSDKQCMQTSQAKPCRWTDEPSRATL